MDDPEWSKSDDAKEKDDLKQGRSTTLEGVGKVQTPPWPVREVAKTPSRAKKRMGEQAKKHAQQNNRGSDADVEESEATRRAKSKAKAKAGHAERVSGPQGD